MFHRITFAAASLSAPRSALAASLAALAASVCPPLLGASACTLVALIGLGLPALAPAQTVAPKAAAAPAQPGDAARKPQAKPTQGTARKKAAEPAPEPEPILAVADAQQLLAAKEVLLGESGCEFNQKIQLDANTSHPGYVEMSFNKKKYMMKPVMSSTGALRLEDVRSETLMIQISSKTMLMNQKTGQRLVDNCVHADQKTTAADAEQVLMMK